MSSRFLSLQTEKTHITKIITSLMSKRIFTMSSLSQKYIMAIAGAFLMLFLITHLATNILMLSGRERFDEAVYFLLSNPIIKLAEYVLFAGFLIHIILGVIIAWFNKRARPVSYHVSPKSETFAFSKYMFHTGVIIFIFLVIHLVNFFFVKLGWVAVPDYAESNLDFYSMAVASFTTPLYSGIYLLSFVFLGFHLYHAFQSAFQTFGANHPKYTPMIKVFGLVYTLVITLGFASIPVYFLFFYQ
jgi:succinate dehydrogenase / fumarate reductase, cytochrome b subunit